MKISKRQLKVIIENYLYETIESPLSQPTGPTGTESPGDAESNEPNKEGPKKNSSGLYDPPTYKGFSATAKYQDDKSKFFVKLKSKDKHFNISTGKLTDIKYSTSKTHDSDKVEKLVKDKSDNKELGYELIGMDKIKFQNDYIPPPYQSIPRADKAAAKLGAAARKAVAAGRDASGDGGDSIVKQIEVAIGMKDADDKWTKEGTDKAWRTWVDGKKAAIEKDYPNQLDTLKKSWSKFAKANKDKGGKYSAGASGMLSFIKKYGTAK